MMRAFDQAAGERIQAAWLRLEEDKSGDPGTRRRRGGRGGRSPGPGGKAMKHGGFILDLS